MASLGRNLWKSKYLVRAEAYQLIKLKAKISNSKYVDLTITKKCSNPLTKIENKWLKII